MGAPTSLQHFTQSIEDIRNDNSVVHTNKGTGSPPGSYTKTCEFIYKEETALMVSCWLDVRHLVFRSTLQNFNQCIGDIRNDNGVLHCNKGTGSPPGSYTKTFDYIHTEGTTLIASCSDAAGQLGPPTSLQNFNQCTADIRNDNSLLHLH